MFVCGSVFFSSTIFKGLIVVLASILLDFLLGVLISIKQKTFNLSVLPKFIVSNVFPYVGGLVVLALLSVYLAQMDTDAGSIFYGFYYTAAGIVTLKFSKEALSEKIAILFNFEGSTEKTMS